MPPLSFPSRNAALKHYEQEYPHLPPHFVELALDFDIAHPDFDPENPDPEIVAAGEKLKQGYNEFKEGDIVKQGTIYDHEDDMEKFPPISGFVPATQEPGTDGYLPDPMPKPAGTKLLEDGKEDDLPPVSE